MPDIRSFFGPKGGAPPPKPTPKKQEEPAKKGRGSMFPGIQAQSWHSRSNTILEGRKVVEDSDEDDAVE